MNEPKQKASVGLRIAAALCLGVFAFAAVQLARSHSGEAWSDFLKSLGSWSSPGLFLAIPFALFASVYVLITGRVPSLGRRLLRLDENPDKPKWHWVGMTIVWIAVAAIIGAIACLLYVPE